MDTKILQRHFQEAVAPLAVTERQERSWRKLTPDDFTLDVRVPKGKEEFILRLAPHTTDVWDFDVTNADASRRHVLLVATGEKEHRRFLCGHDERHLFVAGIKDAVTTVTQAMESLKPALVKTTQDDLHVAPKERNQRRNPGFIRQGEWFFLPQPSFAPNPLLVLHHEPLRRSRSNKIHWVEWLYREVGRMVYVCSQYPDGIFDEKYRELIAADPDVKLMGWRQMTRTTKAYAKGYVRHPDHATIHLPCWHEMVVNGEIGTSVAFLD